MIVIVGPTAAGKSQLAIGVARAFDGEVVSGDAAQVYRGLDLGTAKVDAASRASVPHHCLDLVDPDCLFSAGDFARAAAAAIDDIRRRGRQPVAAGGSGLYLRALIEGLAPLPSSDRRWRQALEAVERRRGLNGIYKMLQVLDGEWAAKVGAADRQRILRALEVTLRLGVPFGMAVQQHEKKGPRYCAEWVGLAWPRQLLYERISARVDSMLAAGWLNEVADLLAAGVSPQAPAFAAIGYQQLVAHLAGKISLEEARQAIVRSTRQLAKRQLTWFRKQTPARWFLIESSDRDSLESLERQVLGHLRERLSCYDECRCP
ncbi:MAG: tRNA (adenosine(37)-N6)-dimethylallyltransferase MiaA [Acidobacteriota bacterium]